MRMLPEAGDFASTDDPIMAQTVAVLGNTGVRAVYFFPDGFANIWHICRAKMVVTGNILSQALALT